PHLHPIIRNCLDAKEPFAAVSGVSALTHRHRELLNSLLRPPVLASAQRLWYEIKALEFATEFFFTAEEGETLCTRAQRVAAEREGYSGGGAGVCSVTGGTGQGGGLQPFLLEPHVHAGNGIDDIPMAAPGAS